MDLTTKDPQKQRQQLNELTGLLRDIRGPGVAHLAPVERKPWAKSFINQRAPDLIVETWISAAPDTQGKFILVDFMATWCEPCREAIEELNKIHATFGDKLVVIGLSDEPEQEVRAHKEPRIEYYSATDTRKRMKSQVEVTAIPHVMIIDPQGIVRWEGSPLLGGHRLTVEVVRGILEKYPIQSAPPASETKAATSSFSGQNHTQSVELNNKL